CRVAAVETTIVRPKTFIGPERLGVFEILFDWIREGRRIYTLGKGNNRYQLLAVEDLVDAIVRAGNEPKPARETFNVGATEFGTVRSDLQALIDHAGSSSRLQPVPVKPAEIALRGLELLRVSPLAEWHYKTAHRDLTAGEASLPPRMAALVQEREGLIGVMPAYLPSAGLACKLVTLFPQNVDRHTHQAVIVVFDPENGTPLAVMDGTYITATRTAAGSALATRLLAREDAEVLALLGTGVQARSHARA